MGHYPFTLFNGATVMVLAITIAIVWRRWRGSLAENWPLAGYALIVGYTLGFSGGLNPYWVAAGAVCAVTIRRGFHPRFMRRVEAIPLAYVACRCVGLLLMW
jgi:hypothetical protein